MEKSLLVDRKTSCWELGNISLRKLEYLIASKQLKAVRIGKRVMVQRAALEAFAKKGQR